MMNKELKLVVSQYITDSGVWHVQTGVDSYEIIRNDKKLLKYLLNQDSLKCDKNGVIALDDFIQALDAKFYRQYKNFIIKAIDKQVDYQNLAYDIYKLCRCIYKTGQRIKFEDGEVPQAVVDLMNYVCDRSLVQELELNEMCALAWRYAIKNLNK